MSDTVNQIENGAFQTPEGEPLANGYLLFELNQDAVVNTSTRICAGSVIRVTLDANGNVPSSTTYSLWPNSVMTPDIAFYTLSGYSSAGQLVYGPNPVQIPATPSPFDLSTLVPGDINS